MNLPTRILAIINTLYQEHQSLAKGTDDERRALTRMIIEQIVFEFPGQGWGWKSADPTRPPSKDAIARLLPDGHLWCWDWQNGSTRAPISDPTGEDITGQHFIAVAGVDHLGAEPVPPPKPPIPPTPPPDELVALLGAHGFYLSAQPDGTVECNRTKVGPWEQFKIVRKEPS